MIGSSLIPQRVFYFTVRSNRFFSSLMLFFHHIVLLLSLSKADVLFCIIMILKTISLTCFNNFSKAEAKKKMKKYIIETQSIILKIYVISFPICICVIKFPMYLKHRSSHRWCSLNKVLLKTSQYSQENICVGVSF